MDEIECFNCHDFGNVVANCRRRMHSSMQQIDQPKGGPTFRYRHSFNGHCFSCNIFGHKSIDFRSSVKRWRSNMSSKRLDPLTTYLGHIECYVCHNFRHMAKDCKIPKP